MTQDSYVDQVKLFAQKSLEKRELEAKVKILSSELGELEAAIMERFSQDGISSMKVEGLGTVYIGSQFWATAVKDENGEPDYAKANAALIASRLGNFVQPRFNVQSLSAWVREQPKDDSGNPIVPKPLKGGLDIGERYYLRMRKAQ